MLQLKKFPNIPVSTGEEARESRSHPEEPRFRRLAREEGSFPCVFRKEFLAFPSQLKNFPDIPVSTREEARESRPHPEEPRFRLLLERRDPFPAWSGKNSRHSRRISRGGALHRKGERNSRVVPPFEESPRCLSPFQRNLFTLHCLDVHAEDRLTRWWHVGQPCGKASWESLV